MSLEPAKIDQIIQKLRRRKNFRAITKVLHKYSSHCSENYYLAQMGYALEHLNKKAQAINLYNKLIAYDPVNLELRLHVIKLTMLHNPKQALTLTQELIHHKANNPLISFLHAETLFHTGDFKSSWKYYETRLYFLPQKKFDDITLIKKKFSYHNKILAIHTEQGIGDTIQFARYLPLLALSTKKILFICEPFLCKLFSRLPYLEVIDKHTLQEKNLSYDFSISLHSLPFLLDSTNVPPPINLSVSHLQNKLILDKKKLNIGIVWSGSNYVKGRNIPLEYLEELFKVESIQLHSFQLYGSALGLANPKLQNRIINHEKKLTELTITADFLQQMDLFITIDTGLAHLAASLGITTWVLLKYDSCWRWVKKNSTPIWYPELRLFKQKNPTNWMHLAFELEQALTFFARRYLTQKIKKIKLTHIYPTTWEQLFYCPGRYQYLLSLKKKEKIYINSEFLNTFFKKCIKPVYPANMSDVTYIIPFFSSSQTEFRVKNLHYILQWLKLSFPELEILIVELGMKPTLSIEKLTLKQQHLFIEYSGPFNKCLALNQGVLHTHKRICVLGDADIIMEPKDLYRSIQILKKSRFDMLKPYCALYNIMPTADSTESKNLFNVLDDRSAESNLAGGIAIFIREKYIEMGGYPMEFKGWGWEDYAMKLKIVRLLRWNLVYFTAYHFDHPGSNNLHHTTHCQNNKKIIHQLLNYSDTEFNQYIERERRDLSHIKKLSSNS